MKSMEGKGENEFCRNSNDGSNRQEQKKNPQNRKEDLGVQGSGMGRIQFFRIVNG
ncbi:hypothetical protein CE91St65_11160 [[Clostridium] symbiosum]|nr:hypothetical protein CE91St65_11160 [[Clostridium] symbiosum]BDF28139.1 hypothetical protein CE91St66_11160 [[Clostridium] symbiosum]